MVTGRLQSPRDGPPGAPPIGTQTRPLPTTLTALEAELRALGLEVEAVPDAEHLRVAGRFGARIDSEPPGLTAWLDDSRTGWIARFADAERMAAAIRGVGRWRRLHAVGVTMLGLAGLLVMALIYASTMLEGATWLGPLVLAIGLLLLVGWPLEVVSRRAMQRSGLAEEVLAWKRGGGLGPLKSPPP